MEPFTVTPAWHGTGGTELGRVHGGTGYLVGDELTLDTSQFEDWKLKNGTKFRVTAVHTGTGFTENINSGDRYVSVLSTSTVQDHSSESAPEYHLCGNPFGNTIRFQVKQYIYPHVTGQGLSNFGIVGQPLDRVSQLNFAPGAMQSNGNDFTSAPPPPGFPNTHSTETRIDRLQLVLELEFLSQQE